MGDTAPERYAVVSCHVERLLDDEVWARYRQLVERRPGGFAIASLVRPPDRPSGESEETWLERARFLAALGPFGQHTHWTAPGHARPTGDGATGERVLREGEWLREAGLGADGVLRRRLVRRRGGRRGVRGARLRRLHAHVVPCRRTSTSRLPARSSTHRRGSCSPRASGFTRSPRPGRPGCSLAVCCAATGSRSTSSTSPSTTPTSSTPRRRKALLVALRLLARRRRAVDLDELVRRIGPFLPERPWAEVARGAVDAPGGTRTGPQ